MPQEGPERATATGRISARLRPIENQILPLGDVEAVHRPSDIEQEAPPWPRVFGKRHENLSVTEAANPEGGLR